VIGLADPSSAASASKPGRPSGTSPLTAAPGTAVVTDKGLSGADTEAFFDGLGLRLALIRPARKDEKAPRCFPNWLRQRVEAIIWTLKKQLGLERRGGRVAAGLWARDRAAAAGSPRLYLPQLDDRRTGQALPHRL
jgi:hypothetical protein